jgi:4-aminobutyrate aminotransferase/(S)-3-amino-2-methylpropionate transaminase
LKRLRAICDRERIVLIVDEIQTGFGRTGEMFAVEHAGVVPDIMVLAKSLGAGMPIAAVAGRAELMDAPPLGGIGGTYGGNPIACQAALATLDLIEQGRLPDRARRIGSVVSGRFRDMMSRFSLVGEVRGVGAMMAMELVRNRVTKEPAPEETSAIIRRCHDAGLIIIKAGLYDNVIRVLVPLVITDAQLAEGLDILESALGAVSGAACGSGGNE